MKEVAPALEISPDRLFCPYRSILERLRDEALFFVVFRSTDTDVTDVLAVLLLGQMVYLAPAMT